MLVTACLNGNAKNNPPLPLLFSFVRTLCPLPLLFSLIHLCSCIFCLFSAVLTLHVAVLLAQCLTVANSYLWLTFFCISRVTKPLFITFRILWFFFYSFHVPPAMYRYLLYCICFIYYKSCDWIFSKSICSHILWHVSVICNHFLRFVKIALT